MLVQDNLNTEIEKYKYFTLSTIIWLLVNMQDM